MPKYIAFKTSEPRLYRVALGKKTRGFLRDQASTIAELASLFSEPASIGMLRPAAIAQLERDRGAVPTRYPPPWMQP